MKRSWLIALGLVILAVAIFVGVKYVLYLQKAHSTFDNYYSFRGCAQLMEKTDAYGICKTSSGEIIKIVKYQNRWYLDGDLPMGWLGNFL